MNNQKFKLLKQNNIENLEDSLNATVNSYQVSIQNNYAVKVKMAYVLYLEKSNGAIDLNKNTDESLSLTINSEIVKEINECYPNMIDDFIKNYGSKYSSDDYLSYVLFAENKSGRLTAEHSTPESIIKLSTKLLTINDGDSVADICCGCGDYLVNVAMANDNMNLYGLEVNGAMAEIAEIRLSLVEKVFNLDQIDAFQTLDNNDKYDKVFSNYPLGMTRLSDETVVEKLMNVLSMDYDNDKIITTDWLFNMLTVSKLKENGKAVVIMPNGTAFNSNEKNIRKKFINMGFVETVIELPPRLFQSTNINLSIMVLSKNNDKVNFVNASEIFTKNRRINSLTDENINDIVSLIGKETENSTVKTLTEIEKEDYSLVASLYLINDNVEGGVDFSTVIKNVTRGAQLKAEELDELHSKVKTPFKYVTVSNINDGIVDISNDEQYLTSIDKKLEKYCVKNRSLLISKITSPDYKIAVVEVEEGTKVLTNGNLYIVELDETKVNPYYLQAFFNSELGEKVIYKKSNGIAFKMLSLSALNKLQIPMPDIAKQNEIGEQYKSQLNKITDLKQQLQSTTQSLKTIFEM